MTGNDIGRKLDRIAAILQLAHQESIEATRAKIRSDETNAAVLGLAGDTSPAGKLIGAVKSKTGQSKRTIKRCIAMLADLGALEKSGGRPTTSYRATGLV